MFYDVLPRYGLIRRSGRYALRLFRPYDDRRWEAGTAERMNLWQENFCAWNAERLGISFEASVQRFRRSWNAMPGGHAGDEYRKWGKTQEYVFSVFADDSPAEIHESYKLLVWMQMLRQVSLPVPIWNSDDPVITALSREPAPTIIDFGCGAAQTSITLASALKTGGAAPQLFLADIPTIRLDFVQWLCRRVGLDCTIGACTPERPAPDYPRAHVVVATEVFHSVHDPLWHFERLDAALVGGGFLITSVADHRPEFMHVSPDLRALRDCLARLGYRELKRHTLYRKPSHENLNLAHEFDTALTRAVHVPPSLTPDKIAAK